MLERIKNALKFVFTNPKKDQHDDHPQAGSYPKAISNKSDPERFYAEMNKDKTSNDNPVKDF